MVFHLFPKNYRLIAMTTMGYGESSKPKNPYTSVEEFAQSVDWFIEGLGLDKFDLFGTHTGGIIAIEVAIRNAAKPSEAGLLGMLLARDNTDVPIEVFAVEATVAGALGVDRTTGSA